MLGQIRMKSNSLTTISAISIIILGFLCVFLLSNFLEEVHPPIPESYADEDLSLQGEKLKGYSFGAEGLLADWYWMRSLQYIGKKLVNTQQNLNLENLNPLNPRLLYPLLDNATTLDPRFMAAYSYGAMVLPAIDKKQAIALIEKGIKNNPDQWRLYQHLGYIYWKSKDYPKAAETYKEGVKIAGSPPFMKSMAAKMTNEGGERETAREIYQQMYNEAQDSKTKESAELRLFELESLDDRDAITASLQASKSATGRCPKTLKEIFPLLLKAKLPNGRQFRLDKKDNVIDPTDAPYLIDPEKCEAKLELTKTKIPQL